MVTELTEVHLRELKALTLDPFYGSSDRVRDRARTKLKRLGMIRFDRPARRWVVLPAGLAALHQENPHAE